MNQSVVKINRVNKGRRPVICRKAGTIKKSLISNTKFIIVDFDRPVLRWAISTGRL